MKPDGEQIINTKKIMEEAYKRLVPAVAYMFGPGPGFAASVTVFTTWLIARARPREKAFTVEEDDKAVVILMRRIREVKARLRALEEALKTADEYERKTIEKTIEAETKILDRLREELELRQLRLEAMRQLQQTGSEELVDEVRKLIKNIEEGREIKDQQYRVLKQLEEKWRRKEIEIVVIRQLLGGGY